MAKKLVLFGAGPFARLAAIYLGKDAPYEIAAFTVHRSYLTQPELLGKPVIPFEVLEQAYPPGEYALFVAIGYGGVNRARADVYAACKAKGYDLISYVNSRATAWGPVTLGANCFVFENVALQPFAVLGEDVIVWSGSFIGHDSVLGDHCFIGPQATVAGNVAVGPFCFIGANATIRDGVRLGAGSVIGAGAVILEDIPPGSVCKGRAAEFLPVPGDRLRRL